MGSKPALRRGVRCQPRCRHPRRSRLGFYHRGENVGDVGDHNHHLVSPLSAEVLVFAACPAPSAPSPPHTGFCKRWRMPGGCSGCSSPWSSQDGVGRPATHRGLTWPVPGVQLLRVFSGIRLLRLLRTLQGVSGLCSRRGKAAGHVQGTSEAASHGGQDQWTGDTLGPGCAREGDSLLRMCRGRGFPSKSLCPSKSHCPAVGSPAPRGMTCKDSQAHTLILPRDFPSHPWVGTHLPPPKPPASLPSHHGPPRHPVQSPPVTALFVAYS